LQKDLRLLVVINRMGPYFQLKLAVQEAEVSLGE
jgi:hypothetical protein